MNARSIPFAQPARTCPGCDHLLSRLPLDARYCPKCGRSLDSLDPPLHPPAPPIASSPFSAVVRGYASALHRLGQRYHFDRNLTEAYRCYRKAARLGNPESFARLESPPPF